MLLCALPIERQKVVIPVGLCIPSDESTTVYPSVNRFCTQAHSQWCVLQKGWLVCAGHRRFNHYQSLEHAGWAITRQYTVQFCGKGGPSRLPICLLVLLEDQGPHVVARGSVVLHVRAVAQGEGV